MKHCFLKTLFLPPLSPGGCPARQEAPWSPGVQLETLYLLWNTWTTKLTTQTYLPSFSKAPFFSISNFQFYRRQASILLERWDLFLLRFRSAPFSLLSIRGSRAAMSPPSVPLARGPSAGRMPSTPRAVGQEDWKLVNRQQTQPQTL